MDKEIIQKLKVYGEDKLTKEELLSLIIDETADKSSIQIASNLIENNKDFTNNLRFLYDISINQLMETEGINEINACKIKAMVGIIKKLCEPISMENLIIESSKDIANLFMEQLRFEKKELIKIVILNNKNVIQKIVTLSNGSIDNINLRVRDILSEPLKMNAPKFILVHNHPSGDSKPSNQDKKASEIIYNCSCAMGIEFLDHIIIGDGNFESVLSRE